MHVLLTCAGRRNYLVQFFREALGPDGHVFAADAAAHAPALREADEAFVLPLLSDPAYLDRLLAICRERRVDLLISLNDHELPLIARHRDRFRAIGTLPVISSPAVIETCYDKWQTFIFLETNGIPTARTYRALDAAQDALAAGDITFPLVIKPRWGSGSRGIERAWDEEELGLVYALATKRYGSRADHSILIQEHLSGDEYGLDVVNDLEGRYAGTLAKRKLVMRSGETDRAITVCHTGLARLGERLSGALGHIGNLDCDVFVSGERCAVLEMNPRFGGGYPFAHAAGANLPAALIGWARGERPDPAWLTVTPQMTASKCDRIVVMSSE
ncbi:MAG: ATP-grasp domain-containing protein [Thermomicrobiales bacterium]